VLTLVAQSPDCPPRHQRYRYRRFWDDRVEYPRALPVPLGTRENRELTVENEEVGTYAFNLDQFLLPVDDLVHAI
jgi:hypothetical protein